MFQRLKQAADKLGSIKSYYKNIDTRLHQEKKNINKVNSMKHTQQQQQQSQFSCYENLKEQSQIISGLYSEKVMKLYGEQKKKLTENIDQTISTQQLQKYNNWIFSKIGSIKHRLTSQAQPKASQTSTKAQQTHQNTQQQQSQQNHSKFDRMAYMKYKWNEFTNMNSPNFNNLKDKMNNTSGSYYSRLTGAATDMYENASRKTRNAKDKVNDSLKYQLGIGKRISKYTLKLIFGGIFIFGFAYSTPQAISHYLTQKHKHEQDQQVWDRRDARIREYQNKPNQDIQQK